MKKFKSLIYVLALALIFVGATGVTKASAEGEEGFTVTWNTPSEGCTVAVTDGDSKTIESGTTTLNKEAAVTVTLTAEEGYTVNATSEDATLVQVGETTVWTFAMPEKNVTLTITATAEDPKEEPTPTPEVEDPKEEPTPTPTGTPSAGKGISEATPNYTAEYIDVTSDKQVFFQIVKAADTSEVKAANWIKAAANGTNKYAVDFSATANTKDVFYALTVDATLTKPDKVVAVDAVIKSAKMTLNYKTETLTSGGTGLYEIIGGFEVKGVDKADDKKWDPEKDGALNTLYTLNWKRGANGTWAAASAFDQLNWDMVKASNSTLYINVSAKKGEKGMDAFRPSKETKLKVPKAAKAPTVKVDYVKGTLGLKNGMQVRVNNNAVWMDVVAYDKTATGKDVFALATANAKTQTKVSGVAVADFITAVKDSKLLNIDVAAGAEITIEARTAATNKKFPSNSGFLKVVAPKAAPTVAAQEVAVTYTEADKTNKVDAAYVLDFSKLFTKASDANYDAYEYVFVADDKDGVNLSKQKWTKLTGDGKVNLAKSIGKDYKYYKKDEAKTASVVKYEAIDAIYIRLAAVKGTKDVAGVFASDYGIIEVAVSKAAATTPTPTPTEGAGENTEFTVTFTVDDASKVTELKVADENASLTNKTVKAAKDATVTFKYTAADGKVAVVKVADNAIEAANGVYSVKVTADVTIVITEEAETQQPETPTTYAITVADGEFEGSVAAQVNGEAVETAAEGATVTIVYTAKAEGATKELDTVTVKDADGTAVEVKDNTFTMPAKAVTITFTEKAATAE